MHTILSRLKFPIVQAPMAGVQDADLTVAVSLAGGLGSLPAAMLTPETLAAELEKIQGRLNGLPYNVNFFAHRNPPPEAAHNTEWLALLQPYFAELGISTDNLPSAARRPFDENALRLIERYRPPVVSFHFGLPEPPLLNAVKAAGAKIFASATTVAEARWLEQNGADAVIAQGWEAGGHRGWFLSHDIQTQSGLFALLPQIVRTVALPVVAAGGIVNATTSRAAFALGAAAIQAGTAFLLADEARTSAAHRAALQSPSAADTAVSNLFSGGAARGIRNRLMKELGGLHSAAPPFPAASAAAGALKAAAEARGCYDFSPFWAGQNASLAQAGSAGQIMQRLLGD